MVQKHAVISRLKFLLLAVLLILAFLVFRVATHVSIQSDQQDFLALQRIAQENSGVINSVSEGAVGIDPTEFLTTWNFNNLPEEERKKYYHETDLEDGNKLREYWLFIENKDIEIAPGVFFPAWTYNGQVPGPTIRATEGDTVRIHLENSGDKPHSIHTHGIHTSEMDGAMTDQLLLPGKNFTYEFIAEPFETSIYHCHGLPLTQHISKGLYGAYIVDPKHDTRPKPDRELVMVMNGFDTNFDEENEVYAVNSIAFYYAQNPIKVKANELVRIHLSNLLEFDQINSFHLHANFFDEYKTGTNLDPNWYTDTTILGQGERSILDIRFKFPGKYMFHAHKTEFAEKGWMGFFEVEE